MAHYRIYDTQINQMFSQAGDIGRWHDSRVRRVRAEIQRRAPVDTGLLRSSWRTKRWPTSNEVLRSTVYTDVEYARYVIEGTANGGTGYIYPRRAQVLRFRGRNGGWVYARRVRGQKPNNFVHEAILTALAGSGYRVRLLR